MADMPEASTGNVMPFEPKMESARIEAWAPNALSHEIPRQFLVRLGDAELPLIAPLHLGTQEAIRGWCHCQGPEPYHNRL